MTEPVTWAAVGMAAVSNMATWIIILKNRNEAKKNPDSSNSKPGSAKICRERGERMIKVETEQKHLQEDIHEIKLDIKEIKEAIVK